MRSPENSATDFTAPTRRSLREAERKPRRQTQPPARPQSTQHSSTVQSPRPLRSKIVSLSAILAVGLMAVSTSIPTFAVDAAAPTTVASAGSTRSAEPAAQALDVGSAATLVAIQRDGYTVKEAPKPAPPTTRAASGYKEGVDFGQLGDQGWVLPVVGRISDPYGPRPNKPVAGVGDFHNGTDIATDCGDPVFAATTGTVVSAGVYGSYGNWILIDHGNGIQTGYAHNSTNLVSEGQTVLAGETIAEVGNTGASSGCHLHFETIVDTTQVDPAKFMSLRGVLLG